MYKFKSFTAARALLSLGLVLFWGLFAHAEVTRAQVCRKLMQAPTGPFEIERVQPEELNLIWSQVFKSKTPAFDALDLNPLEFDEGLHVGRVRQIPGWAIEGFARTVRRTGHPAYRVTGPDVNKLVAELIKEPPPVPNRIEASDVLGLTPTLTALAGFAIAANPHHHVPAQLFGPGMLLSSVAVNLVAILKYGHLKASPEFAAMTDLLDNYAEGEKRLQIVMANHAIKIEGNGSEQARRGFFRFIGQNILRFAYQKPGTKLEFWHLLYFDHVTQRPVFLFGVPPM